MSKIHVDGLVPERSQGTWQRETREISGRLTYAETFTLAVDTDYTVNFPGITEWVMFFIATHGDTLISVGDSMASFAAVDADLIEIQAASEYQSMHIEVQALTFHAPDTTNNGTGSYYVIAALKEAEK